MSQQDKHDSCYNAVMAATSRPVQVACSRRSRILLPRASAWSEVAARALDDELSARPLTLDPAGYFLLSACHEVAVIRVQHYPNTINAAGVLLQRNLVCVARC